MLKKGVLLASFGLVASAILLRKRSKQIYQDIFVKNDNNQYNEALDEKFYQDMEEQYSRIHEYDIISHDGLKLHGAYVESPLWSNTVVIVCHGYTISGKQLSKRAKYYLDNYKFNVFLPDWRGHGKSEGKFACFGVVDHQDLMLWINKIIETKGPQIQIVLDGTSMGAATILQAVDKGLPNNVKCLVADSSFDTLENWITHEIVNKYYSLKHPTIDTINNLLEKEVGFSIYDGNVVKAVSNARVPIIFIHGGSDNVVPTKMVYPLYNACSSEKELVIIPEADHCRGLYIDFYSYHQAVSEFLSRHVKGVKNEN